MEFDFKNIYSPFPRFSFYRAAPRSMTLLLSPQLLRSMTQENFSSPESFSHDMPGVKFSGLNLKLQNKSFGQEH